MSNTYDLRSFNNWIKAVLIQTQTRAMCRKVEEELDLRRGSQDNKLLHVLDIGCGRGQDITKWRLARVNYMVAVDFSEECIKTY
jgi:2-polyprenyl-3-methyl-5-hydroxy-6-metoxy-1,4-benzoquinol methylase